MIPESHSNDATNANQEYSSRDTSSKTSSTTEQLSQELFASLQMHAQEAQKLSNEQLFSLLPVFDEDCKKVHAFCQKIFSGEISTESEMLSKMTGPLSQMTTKLENAEKPPSLEAAENVLNHLHEEIDEIQRVIQFKTSLNLVQFDSEEEMPSLDGWHFQNLTPENQVEQVASSWRLNSLKNILIAALYSLGSPGTSQTATNDELESENQATLASHKVKVLGNSALAKSQAKRDHLVIHTHDPTANSQQSLENQPKEPGVVLGELRREVGLTERTLASSISCILPEWPDPVEDQCYEIAGLEESIGRLMNEARQFISPEEQEAAKCGVKHLNLLKQAQLIEGLKLKDIVVPIPHGVPHDKVLQFLQKQVPELFDEWEELGRLYENYQGITPFLDETDVKNHLMAIDRLIERAFQIAGVSNCLQKSVQIC